MKMKEIYVVRTEKETVSHYWNRLVLSDLYPSEMVPVEDATTPIKPVISKTYDIKKLCECINNELVIKEYVITDPFLESIIDGKSREWRHLAEMNNKLTHSANRLQEKADEDRKLYSYILAHPFKYAFRRLFKLDAPEGSIG